MIVITHRCDPDDGPRLNSVHVTTPINIFARGGAGIVSFTKISKKEKTMCHVGCGLTSRLERTCFDYHDHDTTWQLKVATKHGPVEIVRFPLNFGGSFP